ncbi:glycosyltransferase family 8 protein [Mycolicibacterium neoaurum]|uniref:glycosyltransferase family 8 protein n=1 Tax=Mycolicibacterium neoaurum TaxID=1795 RepID=UPI001F4C6B51|nr:glycosyltransferase family 8 protein [Mycolicibacterium neoaurum]
MRPADEGSPFPPIVCCIDDRYVLPLCVLLESLFRAHSQYIERFEVYVVHDSLTREARARINLHANRLCITVNFVEIDPVDFRYPIDGPQPGQFTKAVYLRLSLGEVLAGVPRALYLDADTIILDDIRPLLFHPLNGFPVGAVQDPIQPTLERGYALPGWREEGIPGDREYFNSGVLLFDLESCLQRDVFERAKQFLTASPGRAACLDQDALNWALDDAWVRLDPRWNTINSQAFIDYFGVERMNGSDTESIDAVLDRERSAYILHFAGSNKPWSDGFPRSETSKVYRRFLTSVLACD